MYGLTFNEKKKNAHLTELFGFEPVGLKTKKGSLRRFEHAECKDNAHWVE